MELAKLKYRNAAKLVDVFLVYSGRQKLLFAALVGFSVAAALMEGLSVTLIVPLLDLQSGSNNFADVPVLGYVSSLFDGIPVGRRVLMVAGLLSLAVLTRGGLQFLSAYFAVIFPLAVKRELIIQNVQGILDVPLSFIHDRDFGSLSFNTRGNPDRVAIILRSSAIILSNLFIIAVYAVMMAIISWKLTLAALTFLAILATVARFFTGHRLAKMGEVFTKTNIKQSNLFLEIVQGMKLVRLLGAERLMLDRFVAVLDKTLQAQRGHQAIQAFYQPFFSTMTGLFIAAFLVSGVLVYGDADITWLGVVILFLVMIQRNIGAVGAINGARSQITTNAHGLFHLERHMAAVKSSQEQDGCESFQGLQHSIRFDNVTFAYEPNGKTAVQGVSLDIPKCRMVALVGPSGAGKSTIINLLVRFYRPTDGRILVDETDLSEIKIATLRAKIGMVSQDVFLMNDTVEANISFGREGVSFADVQQAAKLAHADEFIEKLSLGYKTPIGDRGVRLSGGQQQRLAIARALLGKPEILILDEATSNLDTLSEASIQSVINDFRSHMTIIVIAHRLSTVMKADNIVLLRDGRVVAQGSHLDLLKDSALYQEMVEKQRL